MGIITILLVSTV